MSRFAAKAEHTIANTDQVVVVVGNTQAEVMEKIEDDEAMLDRLASKVKWPNGELVWKSGKEMSADLTPHQLHELARAQMEVTSPSVAAKLFRNGAGPDDGVHDAPDGEGLRAEAERDPQGSGG